MASFDFLSLRFENISENENDTYSVFLNEGEDGPEMVWYDSMGDPIIEVGISKSEWDDVKKLAGECDVASWDGFSESTHAAQGEQFLVEIRLTDGTSVRAIGDFVYPDHYFEVMEKWSQILHQAAIGSQ